MLTESEIADIDRRIQRAGASNCWTGTNGSLAADARRLVKHIRETDAVCNKTDEYPVEHILRGERELKHYLGEEAAILTEDDVADLAAETKKAADIGGSVVPQPEAAGPPAAVRLLDTARAAVIDRHAVYGPPREHFARTVGMVNALFAGVLRRPLTTADWARIMLLDKLARDLGPKAHPDNAVDIAGYAACLAECQSVPPPGP